MCKKWTEEEFQARVKALDTKKKRKAKIKNGVDCIKCIMASSSIMLILYKIADTIY